MKFSHFNSIKNFCNHFRSSPNLLSFSFFSTTVRPRNPSNLELFYRKISPMGDPNVSIVPVLDQWIEDGRNVEKSALLFMIKELRNYGRHTHALQVPFSLSFCCTCLVARKLWEKLKFFRLDHLLFYSIVRLMYSQVLNLLFQLIKV